MKRSLLFALLLCSLGPASLAHAENSVGVWRWLGMGWGSGYHAGNGASNQLHMHPSYSPTPAWGEPGPEMPGFSPAPAVQPLPDTSGLRGGMSPAQQAAIRRESQRRSAMSSPANSPLKVQGHLESSRQSRVSQ